jgi:HSP20 family protein
MDRVFEDRFIRPYEWLTLEFAGKNMVPIDMYEEDNNLVVKAPVPGIKPDDLNIQMHDDVLTITGEIKEEKPMKAKEQEERKESSYYLHEQRYGRFERTVRLPYPVLADKAEAIFENGVVTLTLPKAQQTNTKRIPVKAK